MDEVKGKVMSVSKIAMEKKERMSFDDFMSSADFAVKRCFDVLCSIVGMVLFLPLFIVIYIAVKCEDNGPVIFSQERVGYKGNCFTLYKFRSMKVSAESDGVPVLCKHDDERLTRIGAFLRDHHLDELPQLWNVFIGDMSFVGPRPERKYFIDKIMEVNPDYELLFQLRPGLFSMATLYNGYTDSLDKMLIRLEMDLDYLNNRSLWFDLKIIFLTVFYIISGKKF